MAVLSLYQCLNYSKITWWLWDWCGHLPPSCFSCDTELNIWVGYDFRFKFLKMSIQLTLKNFNNLILKSKTIKFLSMQHPISYLPVTGRRGQSASERRPDLPHTWHFTGSSFIKSTAKKKPTYILYSRFEQISYQNDWDFTQEGDVTSAKVASSNPKPVPSAVLWGTWTPAISFLFY